MKNFLTVCCLIACISWVGAQNVGIGTATPANKLSVNGNADFSGNVGIGVASPTAKLHLAGPIRIADGSQGQGKVLTSDANGLASWTTPEVSQAKTAFFFGTDQSLGNNDFLGMGTSSAGFGRNSIVVPVDCELTSVVFSIRELVVNANIVATVWKQTGTGAPTATNLSAVISNGTTTISVSGSGSSLVKAGDLISVRLNWSTGGALGIGATAAVLYR